MRVIGDLKNKTNKDSLNSVYDLEDVTIVNVSKHI